MSAEIPSPPEPPDADRLRAAFDAAAPYTIGIEDEVMLLDPESLELAPHAPQLLARLEHDPAFKLELPASQIEILTAPAADVGLVESAMREARRNAALAADGLVRLAGAGVHPFSSGIGELNSGGRYEQTIREYGPIASRQLVCALQVHISVGDSERALAVYNALRSYLPLIAALGANAPFYEGRDTGLASVRPKLAQLLPRQGVPPPMESWESYAETLSWGARAGTFRDARTWWWELRPHPRFGTLELRVPDGQSTVREAVALAALGQALVAWLGERHDSGERLPVAPSWRIEENCWSACRHGTAGAMADLQTGGGRPTRDWLIELLEALTPTAQRLGGAGALAHAAAMVETNGAVGQRLAAESGGPRAAAAWLAARFLD